MGVSLANNTILNARGPDITRRMARPVSFFINLKRKKKQSNKKQQFSLHKNDVWLGIGMEWKGKPFYDSV